MVLLMIFSLLFVLQVCYLTSLKHMSEQTIGIMIISIINLHFSLMMFFYNKYYEYLLY
jgi:hypothetical protein